MAGTDAAVAIYWDFENVHACLVDDANGDGAYRASRFKVQEPIVDIDPVTEYAATFGRVVVHRAYANWQYFGRYRDELQAHAIDLAQLFPLAGSKNGADIRLVLDVAEDLQHHPHLTHVIVVASDSDYTPLAQRCRKHGRYFHGVGTERTASSYRFACDEFRRYRDLAGGSPGGQAAQAPADAAREVVPLEDGGDLVVRAIRRLAAGSGESWVRKAGVRPLVKRLDPTFDESGFGYPTFTELLRALDAAGYIAERPGEHDHEVAVRADLERGGADGEERGRPAGDWAAHERPAQDVGGLRATGLAGAGLAGAGLAGAGLAGAGLAGAGLAGAGLAGAGLAPGGPWQPASASAVLIERQLRRRGLRLPTSRRVLWDLPDLMVAAFAATPDGTAASFEDLRLAVEGQAPAGPGAEAGATVPEADFNKVKSILLHARAFTLLGRDRGISLQVPDAGRLRALIVGQLLRHLADPGDEEPAVLAEAFFGPSASEEQRELVATVLRTPPAEAAAVGLGATGGATVVPAPREAGHLLGDGTAAETPAE
jgi:NYN domain